MTIAEKFFRLILALVFEPLFVIRLTASKVATQEHSTTEANVQATVPFHSWSDGAVYQLSEFKEMYINYKMPKTDEACAGAVWRFLFRLC